MPRAIHIFRTPDRFIAGTVGQPGNRTFYLQAVQDKRVVSVLCEKQQVAMLAERVGALLRDLLAPVGSRVAERAGLSSRAVRTVIDDKLRAEGRRLRLRDGVEDPSRVEAVLRGTGFVPRVPQRWVDVTPDGGGVVRLPVPSVCCVLHTRARDSACPTCPKHDPAARTRRTQDWLESLDDAGFREIAGRERVIRPGGSGGGVGARD